VDPELRFPGWLDAIVTDPPYGIREQKLKQAAVPPTSSAAAGALTSMSGCAHAERYDISILTTDLIMFAAEALVLGGRVVFWLPTPTSAYSDDEIPRHPLLRLELDKPQNVSLKVSRRLVVMVKIRDFLPASIVASLGVDGPVGGALVPKKPTGDVRKLLDETNVPENEAYQHYRAKRKVKQEASRAHREAAGAGGFFPRGQGQQPSAAMDCNKGDDAPQGVVEAGHVVVQLDANRDAAVGEHDVSAAGSSGAVLCCLSKRQQRKAKQREAVDNRARRMEERMQRQLASHAQQQRGTANLASDERTTSAANQPPQSKE
jgi:hypothetical protein